jgi:hypothetical protein
LGLIEDHARLAAHHCVPAEVEAYTLVGLLEVEVPVAKRPSECCLAGLAWSHDRNRREF